MCHFSSALTMSGNFKARSGICVASHPSPEGVSGVHFYLPVSAASSCFDDSCFPLSSVSVSVLYPVFFPPYPLDTHWHRPLTSFPLSWSLSSCLVTAFPTSPSETIATGSLEMRPFILLLSFAFPPLQALHVDAPITGTQAGCFCPRPIHSHVDSGSRSCWELPHKVSLCFLRVLPVALKDSRISKLMLKCPHDRQWQRWKKRRTQ